MIKEFKSNHWYRWIGGKEQSIYWNPNGCMNFILDGKPHQCKIGFGKRASFFDSYQPDTTWYWVKYDTDWDNFEEVPAPNEQSDVDDEGWISLSKEYPAAVFELLRLEAAGELSLEFRVRDRDTGGWRYKVKLHGVNPASAHPFITDDYSSVQYAQCEYRHVRKAEPAPEPATYPIHPSELLQYGARYVVDGCKDVVNFIQYIVADKNNYKVGAGSLHVYVHEIASQDSYGWSPDSKSWYYFRVTKDRQLVPMKRSPVVYNSVLKMMENPNESD